MPSTRVPRIGPDWALFLDLDGTLLDIAPRPDAVAVPEGLVASLRALQARLAGAVAVVSGRPPEDADRFLAPLRLPGGFGHGAELRAPDGGLRPSPAARPVPPATLAALEAAAAGWPGVLVERKRHSVAMHFRLAPEREDAVRRLMQASLPDEGFAILPAAMAFEMRPRAATKAIPVEFLMQQPPFRGRRPVFVGDDVTDEDGMAAARRLGGLGLHVARDFGGGPERVRRWLAEGCA